MGLGFPWGLWLLADAFSNVGLLRVNGDEEPLGGQWLVQEWQPQKTSLSRRMARATGSSRLPDLDWPPCEVGVTII